MGGAQFWEESVEHLSPASSPLSGPDAVDSAALAAQRQLLTGAIDAILSALAEGQDPAFRVSINPGPPEMESTQSWAVDLWSIGKSELRGSGEISVIDSESGPALDADELAAAAEWLQEVHVEETYRTTPTCPGHTHPAEPRVVDQVAYWICPATRDHLRPIVDRP